MRVWNQLLLSLLIAGGVGCKSPKVETQGNVLRVALNTFPTSLDPACLTESISYDVLTQVHSCLVSFDQQAQIEPNLADYTVNSSDREIKFALRPARFSDGTQVTADHVRAAWERALLPSTASPLAELYLGDIEGASEVISGKSKALKGLKITDSTHFTVKVTTHPSTFLNKITYPVAAIATGKAGQIGCGPYRIAKTVGGESLELMRVRGSGPEKITFRVVSDSATRLLLFKDGKIDLIQTTMQDRKLIANNPELKQSKLDVNRLSTTFIQFQPSALPALKDQRIREALELSIDFKTLLADQAQGGIERLSGNLTHPAATGWKFIRPSPYDVARAKALFAEAGFPEGRGFPTLTLAYADTQRANPVVEGIVTQWRAHLGIDAVAASMNPAILREKNLSHQLAAFYTGWVGDYPHIENFIPTVFLSTSPSNNSQFRNPEVDDLIQRANTANSTDRQLSMLQRAAEIALSKHPIIIVGTPKETWLISPHWDLVPAALGLAGLDQTRVRRLN